MKHLILTDGETPIEVVDYSRVIYNEKTQSVTCEYPLIQEEDIPLGYIDLGLTSGTQWASHNVGAEKPCDYGKYFQWGDTEGYYLDDDSYWFGWENYKYADGHMYRLTKYVTDPDVTVGGHPDNKLWLEPMDDAAYQESNGEAHIPTWEQCQELLAETTCEICNCQFIGEDHKDHEVMGAKFTNKSDSSKFIFIPFTGRREGDSKYKQNARFVIWSNTLNAGFSVAGYTIFVDASQQKIYEEAGRHQGLAIRGVKY